MIDAYGKITEDLPVLREIKVLQAVFVLPRCVVLHEFLVMKDNDDFKFFTPLHNQNNGYYYIKPVIKIDVN